MRGFSEMPCLLIALTRAGVEWEWSTPQHQAFNMLKLALTAAPVLKLPDFDPQSVVTTDVSDVAVGAIQRCASTATGLNGNGRFNGTRMAVAPVPVAASAGSRCSCR